MEKSITGILDIINNMPKNKQLQLKRIFLVSAFDSSMNVPKEKELEWGKKFEGIEKLKHQRIVRADNIITHECTLFNSLRASRPMQKSSEALNLDEKGDDFCNPLIATPYDKIGRIEGKYSITAANFTKYDCYHDVIMFKEHNPLKFTYESLSDGIETALRWFKKTNEADKKAVYPFLIWNCLWRSGASMIHGHMQATLTKNKHYPKVELLKEASENYKQKYKKDYFNEIYEIHKNLGLAFEYKGIKVIVSLTPIKEKEIILIGKDIKAPLKTALYKTLKCLRDDLNVKSFNVAFFMAPLKEKWSNFPCIIRIVDRGDLNNKTTDIGAMELYAGSSIVAADPFNISKILSKSFKK